MILKNITLFDGETLAFADAEEGDIFKIYDAAGAATELEGTITDRIFKVTTAANTWPASPFAYTHLRETDGLTTAIYRGRIIIKTGAIEMSIEEQTYQKIMAILNGEFLDAQEVDLPDGRRIKTTDRRFLAERADILRHQIAAQRAGNQPFRVLKEI